MPLLWACALAASCLNPRPEEDPSFVATEPDRGETTGSAGSSGRPADGQTGSSGGASGSGAGAIDPDPAEEEPNGTDAGPDAGVADAAPDAAPVAAPDGGQP